jgi:hypothetical protein
MERRVQFYENQQSTHTDFNRMGDFAANSLDNIVADGIESGLKFTGFQVVAGGPLEVIVAPGRLYRAGRVHRRDDEGGVSIQLGDFLPLVTRRIVTIAVWGNEINTAIEPRTFLVDPETLQTEAEAVATERRRQAEVNAIPGVENANPLPPALDANVLAVAYVTLTTAGIERIDMVTPNRLHSVASVAQRTAALETFRGQAGTQLDTLRTDLSALASRLRGTVRQDELFEVQRDVARTKRALDISDDLTSYGQDPFLVLDQSDSDTDHPDWLARVEEGIRFPAAQQREANINLLNPLEDRVRMHGNFALPRYVEEPRISVLGRDGEIPISQYPNQTVATRMLTMTRRRVRYGSSFLVCTNNAWWRSGRFDQTAGLFMRGGDTFEVIDQGVLSPGGVPKMVRIRQVWYDDVEEPYWQNVIVTENISGAILAQTFLNSQDGWCTSIELFFTQVAAAGNVRVLVCEATHGKPDLERVIAKTVINQADLKVAPVATKAVLGPVYLRKGQRYGIVLITPGAHLVAFVAGNKYGQGTLFYSGDGGAWFQGDLTRDLAMRINYARFDAPRAEVQIEPWELANGIANIDVLAECYVPDGCELVWEIQIAGVWRPLAFYETNILSGLPALVPARVVFVGTTELMPGLTFGAASRVTTWRPRADFTHVSTVRTMPAPVDLVEVRLRLEAWDDARHDCDCTLLTGASFATTVTPDQVEDRVMLEANTIERRFYFDLGTPVSAYKIKIEGETDNVLVTFHVAERVDTARAS